MELYGTIKDNGWFSLSLSLGWFCHTQLYILYIGIASSIICEVMKIKFRSSHSLCFLIRSYIKCQECPCLQY
ncbi:hypothetical protein MANES_16G035850v8 [Manihot esculenta]|uniref:Uncharacterized protein n=1 Tax=Manihot esculenta TaxID=3983 RepID=A0ACB7G564_MANES|nr:hypothetical protein MANES_16G035850v8 [Manihot esculenta]